MNFVAGNSYLNASGQFQVMSVGTATMKLEYKTGPQAGKVMLKRIADMAKLTTTEMLAASLVVAPLSKMKRTRSERRK